MLAISFYFNFRFFSRQLTLDRRYSKLYVHVQLLTDLWVMFGHVTKYDMDGHSLWSIQYSQHLTHPQHKHPDWYFFTLKLYLLSTEKCQALQVTGFYGEYLYKLRQSDTPLRQQFSITAWNHEWILYHVNPITFLLHKHFLTKHYSFVWLQYFISMNSNKYTTHVLCLPTSHLKKIKCHMIILEQSGVMSMWKIVVVTSLHPMNECTHRVL